MALTTLLIATLAAFIIGAIRYSPLLFGAVRAKLAGLDTNKMQKTTKAKMFGLFVGQFLVTFIMAFVTKIFLTATYAVTIQTALVTVGLIWLGYMLTTIVGNALREQRSRKYYAINAGYQLVSLVVITVILVIM